MLIENMKMAFAAIRANKMRSVLTMLGIIIGIGSVIAIVSVGDTMRKMFADLYKDVGITQMMVGPGYWLEDFRESDEFNMEEMDQIKTVFGDKIDYMDNYAEQETDAIWKRSKVKFRFTGVDYNFTDVQELNLVEGRFLNPGDVKGRRHNTVLEEESAKMLFGTEHAVGRTFRATIYGSTDEYTVVGIYREEISPFQKLLMGTSAEMGYAYLPYTLLSRPNDRFLYLRLYADPEMDLEDFTSELKVYIAKLHNRTPQDIYISTVAEEMNSADSMMGGMSMAVGGIAAISLLVGGIGIMNIMLVSVTERTREIGIRKALGAKTRDVLIQFLTESAILSAFGGILGVVIGVGLVAIGGSLFGLSVVVRPSVVLLAVGFSAVVGIFFGLYPASRAAKADPIDALRYE